MASGQKYEGNSSSGAVGSTWQILCDVKGAAPEHVTVLRYSADFLVFPCAAAPELWDVPSRGRGVRLIPITRPALSKADIAHQVRVAQNRIRRGQRLSLAPTPLAWLGVFASALLVLMLPPQLAGFLTGGMLSLAWLPMLAFEVPLALWLIFKGVRTPAKLAG
jgi:hypothetical protein